MLRLYFGWIALCAILFVALSGMEDPSRRRGRILSNEAGRRAIEILRARGVEGYEVVHVAFDVNRWIVLADKVPHTRLREALVVELRATDGSLLTIRQPSTVNR